MLRFTERSGLHNAHQITNLTLVMLIMRMEFLAALDHPLIARMPQTTFHPYRNGFLHPVAHHLAKQNLSAALAHALLPFSAAHRLQLTLTLDRFYPCNIPPDHMNTANLFDLTRGKLKSQVKEFFHEPLPPLLEFFVT
jgi:hypothetical protein